MADRVLIIDADPATGSAISDAFKEAGARVQVIGDGGDAAAALIVFEADFVFVNRDWGGSDLNNLCRAIRAAAESPRLSICVTDADSEEVGADFSLDSPAVPEDVLLVCTELMADADLLLGNRTTTDSSQATDDNTLEQPGEVEAAIEYKDADELDEAEIVEILVDNDNLDPGAALRVVQNNDIPSDEASSEIDLAEAIDLDDSLNVDIGTTDYDIAEVDEAPMGEITSEVEIEAPAAARRSRGRRREESSMNTPSVSPREFLQLRENLNRKEREVVDLKDELFKIQHREIEYIERIEVLEARLANTENDLANLRTQHADTSATLEATAGTLAEVEQTLVTTQETLANTAATLENTERTLEQTIAELETANDNNERLTAELAESQAETRRSIETYEARLTELESSLISKHDSEMTSAQATFDELLAGESRRLTEAMQNLEATLTGQLHRSQAHGRDLSARLEHAEGSARRWKSMYEELALQAELRVAESDAKIAAADEYSAHARADIESILNTLASAQDAVRTRDAALDKLQTALETAVEAVVSVKQVALPVPEVTSAAPATSYDSLKIETAVDLSGGSKAEEADRASLAAVESGRAEYGLMEEVSFGADFDEEFEELDDL